MTDQFNEWWNSDKPDEENPYREETPAYWAWAGWKAGYKAGRKDENEACVEEAAYYAAHSLTAKNILNAIRARGTP